MARASDATCVLITGVIGVIGVISRIRPHQAAGSQVEYEGDLGGGRIHLAQPEGADRSGRSRITSKSSRVGGR
jgi:hypothetical protein